MKQDSMPHALPVFIQEDPWAFCITEPGPRTRLDLYRYQPSLLLHDQIDLTPGSAP